MSTLDSYLLHYEDVTPKTRKGGKGRHLMSNKSTTNEAPKVSKKYAKTRGEHYKDIVIAILVTAIFAFIGGMHFSNQQSTAVKNAVKAAQTPVAQAEVKK